MTHRILQNVLQLDLPVLVLEQAVTQAAEHIETRRIGYRNEVRRLLDIDSPLKFEGCTFLQLYFNQLFENRKSLYTPR